MENKIIIKNITSSIILQLVTIISGFIVPKIILSIFGSSVNGLVSSVNQLLNYISLLEGGVGSVIMAALYKPLANKDKKKISGIVNATTFFFNKIGFIYIIYLILIAVFYPLVVNTGFNYTYSFALVIVLGMNLITQYFFSIQYRLLLDADRKIYYVSLVQTIIIVLNLIAVIVLSRLFRDILLIKLGSAIVYLVQPLMFHYFVKKHYDLDKSAPKDDDALKHRWDGFFINLAAFIHGNTDIVILTLLSSLSTVSVYSVYNMIIMAVRNLVVSVSSAITPSYGRVYVTGDSRTTNNVFDQYQFGMNLVTTFMFTCTMILITPFVMVYTRGINDANYNQRLFGIILCIAEMLYCYREPSNSAAYTASKFKDISKYAVIEALLNIVISIILVTRFDIIGVAIGTAISMFYRTLMNFIYLKTHVLFRDLGKAIKDGIINLFGVFVPYIICNFFIDFHCITYMQWIIKAIVVAIIVLAINVILSWLFYKEMFEKLFVNRLMSFMRRI